MSNKILMPQLVSLTATASGKSKNSSEAFIKAFFSCIGEALELHENVKLKGFGSFKVNRVEARKSVNVSTGTEIRIPPHFKIVFTPSKSMAEKVNREFEWLEITELNDNITNVELDSIKENEPEIITPSSREVEPLVITTPETVPSVTTAGLKPVVISASHHETEEEEQSERLGEELEKDFGDIEPVEPFGPIEPDSPEPDQPVPENKEAENENNAESFDPYKLYHPEEPASEEIYYLKRDEYDNLLKRTDLKTISKHIKKIKLNIDRNEASAKKRSLNYLFISILISAALMTGGFFLIYASLNKKIESPSRRAFSKKTETQKDPSNNREVDDEQIGVNVERSKAAQISADSAINAELKEEGKGKQKEGSVEMSDAPVSTGVIGNDRVTTTRYLTTMAKEYYGNYNLWPYIYIENEAKLGHPDRIKPGTTVVIPSIEKYGINPSNPKDIEKARKLGVQIYQKYHNQ